MIGFSFSTGLEAGSSAANDERMFNIVAHLFSSRKSMWRGGSNCKSPKRSSCCLKLEDIPDLSEADAEASGKVDGDDASEADAEANGTVDDDDDSEADAESSGKVDGDDASEADAESSGKADVDDGCKRVAEV